MDPILFLPDWPLNHFGVQIEGQQFRLGRKGPSALPFSLSIFGRLEESLEIRACARDLRSHVDSENTS